MRPEELLILRIMKKGVVNILLLIATSISVYATHNRAGEITFRQVSGYTYEITITTFTYRYSLANRSELTVEWGDNTTSVAKLIGGHVILPNDYYYNRYITSHTFPGPGIYEILVQDPNRNYGVRNIPNSVNVIFSIKTTLLISPAVGTNNTPQLLNFPIDKAALGHLFIHNPAAFDSDGDSIAYSLTVCTGQDGKPISGYSLPAYSDTFYVDAVTGDLVWNTPVDTGKYNVAMDIMEFRNGIKIGNIVRDMQIEVFRTNNNPPVNQPLPDFCIVAGDSVEFQFTSTDQDNDSIIHTITGGPFVVQGNRASYSTIAAGRGYRTTLFKWKTDCNHIRKLPYQITVKSEDVTNDIDLVDIDNFYITVLAPPPVNLTATPTSSEIRLNWQSSECGAITGYAIYRREGESGYVPDSCENGLPAYTGFVKIAEVKGNSTSYIDNNKDEGLVQGVNYCYRVTALYKDGAESIASDEACTSLIPGFPALLNVSVTKRDQTNGEIFISWAKPSGFNVSDAPGPYVFQILRSSTGSEGSFVLIDSVISTDLNDTVYFDTPLNTLQFPYYYTVKMFNNTPGNRFEMQPGFNEIASSVYIDVQSMDNRLILNIKKKVPWINSDYVIYRQNRTTGTFDSIGTTTGKTYVDAGLQNGIEYCYIVKSNGWRPIENVIYNNSNLSHQACALPVDREPPCAPELNVISLCDSFINILTWTNPNNTCADDVIRYNIYYGQSFDGPLDSLTSTFSANDTNFIHRFTEGIQLAGCYAVTAVDSFENESDQSLRICVDECVLYELPNVFSPNGDNINDIYLSRNLNNAIKTVNMQIFNRFGSLVYETHDPAINWNGKYRNSNLDVPPGVYYYICDVYEPRIIGTTIRTLTGFIHLYTGEGTTIYHE
jgi:gliding motility-associated-like protein